MNDQAVIGITGSFGSGCTTVAKVLNERYGFKFYSLSDTLREEWDKSERASEKLADEALRHELQDFGNELRQKHGRASLSYLAEKTWEKVCQESNEKENLVYDSIRNVAEITFLRAKHPSYYLLAVDCAEGDRWERKREKYQEKNLKYEDFLWHDSRDKNEEGITYGQQVALCVNAADYLIRNDNDPMVTSQTAISKRLYDKLEDPIGLFRGTLRTPTSEETHMSIAYSASLMSQCIKRQVGAVIVNRNEVVVSIGFNENPKPLSPCFKQFGDCYREEYTEQIMEKLKNCPFCKKQLNGLGYPYVCPNCKMDIYREIVRDRAISRCTALHAEERAIINARQADLNGCYMYVTTFPCFNCAQKILDVGIARVYYVESYPDLDSIKLFDVARKMGHLIRTVKFEGVKARAYFRIFDKWRREKEFELFISRSRARA